MNSDNKWSQMLYLQKRVFIIYATSCVPQLSITTRNFSTAKKSHHFVRHMLKNATAHHYCDLKSILTCYNGINTYGPTCQLSLYLTTIKCGPTWSQQRSYFPVKLFAYLLLTSGATHLHTTYVRADACRSRCFTTPSRGCMMTPRQVPWIFSPSQICIDYNDSSQTS